MTDLSLEIKIETKKIYINGMREIEAKTQINEN